MAFLVSIPSLLCETFFFFFKPLNCLQGVFFFSRSPPYCGYRREEVTVMLCYQLGLNQSWTIKPDQIKQNKDTGKVR